MGYKWNPFTSQLDYSPSSASALQVTRIANVAILAGECVKSDSVTNISLATPDTINTDAMVLGIAMNNANVGGIVTVVIMGVIYNAAYVVFPLNKQLFLDAFGGITDIRPVLPTHKFIAPVGKSLGAGSIFVQIEGITAL